MGVILIVGIIIFFCLYLALFSSGEKFHEKIIECEQQYKTKIYNYKGFEFFAESNIDKEITFEVLEDLKKDFLEKGYKEIDFLSSKIIRPMGDIALIVDYIKDWNIVIYTEDKYSLGNTKGKTYNLKSKDVKNFLLEICYTNTMVGGYFFLHKDGEYIFVGIRGSKLYMTSTNTMNSKEALFLTQIEDEDDNLLILRKQYVTLTKK
ncbi:MAG: hypothetical protein MR673_02520 [Fusobacterium perfoetens]|uniref:hypothetical protein n=1 Tax=Fusobacterium perfoetens TaxID=852 RepID=UPI0023F01FC5|nr:hypothetical protein [Fusobacterium perfoetens]MCI6151986.1 hypothetical protein [Fusobacterium perfoetens]MDY3237899.1 hypothetical protein [Fusobacterium perfoetens]